MTKAEIDRSEKDAIALGDGPKRPRDAATLILIDRRDDALHVLIGRRHSRHAFMPGKFVFPGGRTDPVDSRIPVAAPLAREEEARLMARAGRMSATRARAIALSAIRETYEEAGLLVGQRGDFATGKAGWLAFARHGVRPSLEAVRFIARAVTPPGRIRRFDTRFLAVWRSDVATELPDGGPTDELQGLVWLPLAEAMRADIPSITRTVLEELEKRLTYDPLLRPGGGDVPFYRLSHGRFVREIL